jgi:hypothetical protein
MKQLHDSLQKLGKVVCSCVTLQRRCKSYINDVVLPRAGDDGPQIPKALEVPETVIDINNSNKISEFAPTAEWCDEAALVIHPISINGKLEHWNSHLVELNEKATILATKVQVRMKNFLIGRCPSHLMNHWVWSSFTTNSMPCSPSRPPVKGTGLCHHSGVLFEQQ